MTGPSGEFGRDSSEADLRLEIIGRIHKKRDEYLEKDRQGDIAAIAQPDADQSPGRYAVESGATERIPMQHHRMVYRPLVNGERIAGIALACLYIPTPYYERSDDTNEAEASTRPTPQWQDVFVELLDLGGQSMGKYLLNGDGLRPYDTIGPAGDLSADVVRSDDYAYTGNLFASQRVSEAAARMLPFDARMLNQILTDYIPGKQDSGPMQRG